MSWHQTLIFQNQASGIFPQQCPKHIMSYYPSALLTASLCFLCTFSYLLYLLDVEMTDALLSLKIEDGYSIFGHFFESAFSEACFFTLFTYFIYLMKMSDMLLLLKIEDDFSIFGLFQLCLWQALQFHIMMMNHHLEHMH